MESCDCVESDWPGDELLIKYQYISDFLIAVAYFSIPLEFIYFVHRSSFFPYRWVLIQFGAFIILCGATHLINLWTFSLHSKTVAKISTALVSCVTALMLVHIIPDLLSVKTRESFLRNKAEELDREMGLSCCGGTFSCSDHGKIDSGPRPARAADAALDLARQEAETAVRAWNDFLAVMNHGMRTPMHAIISLCSLLLEAELNPEQRIMIEKPY